MLLWLNMLWIVFKEPRSRDSYPPPPFFSKLINMGLWWTWWSMLKYGCDFVEILYLYRKFDFFSSYSLKIHFFKLDFCIKVSQTLFWLNIPLEVMAKTDVTHTTDPGWFNKIVKLPRNIYTYKPLSLFIKPMNHGSNGDLIIVENIMQLPLWTGEKKLLKIL